MFENPDALNRGPGDVRVPVDEIEDRKGAFRVLQGPTKALFGEEKRGKCVMLLAELVDGLSALIEREHADVVRGLRDTWNPQNGTLDGHWVSELQRQMLSLLGRFDDSDKVEDYNEIADAEGLSRVDEPQSSHP